MPNTNSTLRFDHREVAVIFSLFIFVSLLMFTVGIVVGKGLAQAKYETALLSPDVAKALAAAKTPTPSGGGAAGLFLRPDMQAMTNAAKNAGKKPEDTEEGEDAAPARKPTSKQLAAMTPPASFAEGIYTVQVGSYPTEKDAAERVEALRKIGFPHAYFSAKELGDQKETWFRVWLGYYPDLDTAKKSGEMLQQRGEVKNYLVRKTDSSG